MIAPDGLVVGLEGWILQDGNYPDFVTGQQVEFALEFWVPDQLDRLPAGARRGYRYTGRDDLYEVSAEVIHVEHAVVLDFGICAYDNHLIMIAGDKLAVGDYVAGVISLSVDHFEYFEFLAKKPGMPALVYRWTVEEIQLDTTPGIRVEEGDPRYPEHLPPEGPVRIRDITQESWRTIDQTQMWDDVPDGIGLYRLQCARHDTPPTHTPHGSR